MIESMFAGQNYQATKALMDVNLMRHRVMAGNLANVDTPGYKRLDIEPGFQKRVEAAIRSGDVASIKIEAPRIQPEAGLPSQRPDGNNVSSDRELMLINQNALEYQMLTEFVSNSLERLRTAISGRL